MVPGMPVPITDQQAADLQAKVANLLTDKTDADSKTAASNSAQSALAQAQQAAQDANVAEAAADGKVNVDIQDLLTFVNSLTGGSTPSPAPTPTPGP